MTSFESITGVEYPIPSLSDFTTNQENSDEINSAVKESLKSLSEAEGFDDLVSSMMLHDETLTQEHLSEYISNDNTAVEAKLAQILEKMTNGTQSVRSTNSKVIDKLLEYLNERKKTISETERKIRQRYYVDPYELPKPAELTIDALSHTWNSFSNAFSSADMKGKLLIGAGVFTTFIAIRKLMKFKYVKKTVGVALGAGLMYSLFSVVNKSAEHMYGRPLVNLSKEGAGFFPLAEEQEVWDKAKQRAELEREWNKLRNNGIPTDEFADFVGDNEKASLSYCITNICALTNKELKEAYEGYKAAKQIPANGMRMSPFTNDLLNPTNRYNVVVEVVKALGYIQQDGDDWQWNGMDEYKEKTVGMVILEKVEESRPEANNPDQ